MKPKFKFKKWLAKKVFDVDTDVVEDASGAPRDPADITVKKVGLRLGDITTTDFEDPDFDLTQIQTGYNTDSYIRQGVDKYTDQIFKEGFDFYSKNEQALTYIKLRFKYISEVTRIPTQQLFTEISEDVVKYSNCFIAKARVKDPNQLPPGETIAGIGGSDPVAGYFPINATTMKIKRDKNGLVKGYQQSVDDTSVKFKPEDMIHIFYKREKGQAMGTPFLWPVLDDVRALRQAEENVLRMMYRNIHPFNHVSVGDADSPGTPTEVAEVQDALDNMEIDGGLVTSNRVKITPIASDQVINAQPYLAHIENRVFSGMGIPAILFGRGDTANRSTGDNQSSEMTDRIKALQRTIEDFINEFMIKELLMEGGYDPVLNEDDIVMFKFKENDMDSLIKYENHIIYKFEHNAIDENEMRFFLKMDPVQNRNLLNRELAAELASRNSSSNTSKKVDNSSSGSKGTSTGASKEATNKNKPTNQHGTKNSPKRNSDSIVYNEYLEMSNVIDEILFKTTC